MKLIFQLFLAATLLAGAFGANAQEKKAGGSIAHESVPAKAEPAKPAKPDLAKGEASFAAVCSTCHGADGNSGTPANPKLSQQHPQYLIKQLLEFKSGKRNNAVMKGFASTLSEDDMKNIAYWVTSKPAKAGFA